MAMPHMYVALLFTWCLVASADHYEKPPCQSDEVQAQLQGGGELCAPPCSGSTCPVDVPAGVTASAKCILKDSASDKSYCGLVCTKDSDCGTEGATCSKVALLRGVCTFPAGPAPAVNMSLADEPVTPSEEDLAQMWARFQRDFKRDPAVDHEAGRFAAFKLNVNQAIALNWEAGASCTSLFDDASCVFGITKFSDMFPDEFKATMMGYKPTNKTTAPSVLSADARAPGAAVSSIDWRTKGAVTPVKDQGGCGSCWAFSTTEEIESAVFMKTGKLEVLSTQQIVACDKVDQGCNGGDTTTAYKYIEKAGGLDLAKDYPDTSSKSGRTGKCKWDKKKAAEVTGFTYATKPCTKGSCKNQDEDALAAALAAKGPVSICVNAGGAGWQNYKRGIYSVRCSGAASQLDHCVQLVGFDRTGSKPYWIVRNSWAADWGEDGYMRLEMGKNLCGVADEATIAEATLAETAATLLV